MKTPVNLVLALLLLSGPALHAVTPPPPPGAANDEVRAAPPAPSEDKQRGEQRRMRRLDRKPREMEKVTFLGVETAPVSRTLIEQLAIAEKAGLVVLRVVPNSSASGVLKAHDVLLRLDEQILVDRRQLSVLVRNRNEGEEVTVTYLRSGQRQTAKIKLTQREVPKMADVFRWNPHAGAAAPLPPGPGHFRGEEGRRMLELFKRDHRHPVRIRIDGAKGPGMRAVSVDTANTNLVFSDEQGSLEVTDAAGKKTLVAKDPEGKQVFSGDVTTPEARAAMPSDLLARLEKLEAMQDVTFHTSEHFQNIESSAFEDEAEPAS